MKVIKTLAKSIREYKKESILTPILVMIEVIMECFIPLIVSYLINTLNDKVTPGAIDNKGVMSIVDKVVKYFVGLFDKINIFGHDELMLSIIVCGLLIVVMAFISLFGGWLAAKLCAKAAAGFSKNLRHDIYYKIQSFSFENIDKFSTSSLVTRMTTDVFWVQMAYSMIIRTAVRSPLMLTFSVILAFTFHKTLPLVFLVVLPLMILGLTIIFIKSHPIFERVFRRYDHLNETVQENVRGMRVVKAYVREDYETQKFEEASASIRDEFVKAERIISLNTPLMMSAIYICMTVINIFGAKIIIESGGSALNLGDLTSLTTYTMQMLMSLMMFSMVFLMVVLAAESSRRIVEVLKEEPTIVSKEDAIKEVKDGSVEFKNVSFKYSKSAQEYALKDINLNIESGKTIGIIGGTGSSKTTLIQLISRLYDVTDGEVLVSGINVKNYDLETLRNEVAVVLQKNVLFSGSIKDNLRWGNLNATDEEMVEACKLAQAHDFIESFPEKYDTHIDQGGSNVSGGQKQRLCIARALLKKPKILILDDSTSAVDTKTDALIRKGFKEFIPETTKIIIAQRISSVEDADMTIVMNNGMIDEIGTHKDLLSHNKIYREVYFSQNKEYKEVE